MNRDVQVRQVEQGFDALAAFAATSWSNLEIVKLVKALQQQARLLYAVPPPPAPPPCEECAAREAVVPEPAPCGICAARDATEAERRERGHVETGWPPAGEKWG